jgi:hypothetical protein
VCPKSAFPAHVTQFHYCSKARIRCDMGSRTLAPRPEQGAYNNKKRNYCSISLEPLLGRASSSWTHALHNQTLQKLYYNTFLLPEERKVKKASHIYHQHIKSPNSAASKHPNTQKKRIYTSSRRVHFPQSESELSISSSC